MIEDGLYGRWEQLLAGLEAGGGLRRLADVEPHGRTVSVDGRDCVNLSSNDYLGLSADIELQGKFLREADTSSRFLMSSPSSRLMAGNGYGYRDLEDIMASMFPSREVLVAGNGYAVNTGVLPALTGRGDLVLADKLVHASIVDGLRLCRCRTMRFRHNDMEHLRSILEKERRNYDAVWVVTESVFSMDGDRAPLDELARLKERFGVRLYLDEAHAFGVFGHGGRGYAAEAGVGEQFDIIVGTFGKALCSYGAFAVVEPVVKKVLVNRMRTVIYSTALAPLNLLWTRNVLQNAELLDTRRELLRTHIAALNPSPDATQIVPVICGSNEKALAAASRFAGEGFLVTAVRTPTVPAGSERIRISLTAALTGRDIDDIKDLCGRIGQ